MSGFVTCSKHNTRRKANYCEEVPIFDADHKVVGHTFVCREDAVCASATKDRHAGRHGAVMDGAEASASLATADGAASGIAAAAAEPALVFDASSSRQAKASGNAARRGASGGADSADGAADMLFSVSFTRKPGSADPKPSDDVSDGDGPQAVDVDASGGDGASDSEEDGGSAAPAEGKASAGAEDRSFPPAAPTTTFTTPRTQPRYYDLTNGGGRGGGAAGGAGMGGMGAPHHARKVCWNCGLSGHEKPDCPNTLCRTCHDLRTMGQYHRCTDTTEPSPFVVPPPSLPFTHPSKTMLVVASARKECGGFDAVRCVRCGCYGHMDCGPTNPQGLRDSFVKLRKEYIAAAGVEAQGGGAPFAPEALVVGGVSIDDIAVFQRLSCNFCAASGHSGYDCNQRDRINPDRWVERNFFLAGSGGNQYPHPPPQQQQQQRYGNAGYAGGSHQGYNDNIHYSNNRSWSDGRRQRDDDRDDRGRGQSRRMDHGSSSSNNRGGVGSARDAFHTSYSNDNHNFNNRSGGGGHYSSRNNAPSSPSHSNYHASRSGGGGGYHGDHSGRQDGYRGGGHSGHSGDREHYQRRGSNSNYGGGGGGYRSRNDGPPREHQGRGRRGGRSGHSGFSDEDALY